MSDTQAWTAKYPVNPASREAVLTTALVGLYRLTGTEKPHGRVYDIALDAFTEGPTVMVARVDRETRMVFGVETCLFREDKCRVIITEALDGPRWRLFDPDPARVEAIARICHEANAAFCLAQHDDSQRPWTDAPEWQRDSARAGVRLHLAHPDITPADGHRAWMAHKLAEGWTFGPVKDADKKTHPCLVPYHTLPEDQQRKDALFKGIVDALR